ncbi:ALAT2 aminotransferase, partial [Polypterus senegalus]
MVTKEEKKWAARVEKRRAAQEAASAATSEQMNDVDECQLAQVTGLQACSEHASCLNTLGSFSCTCEPGFVLALDGKSCVDVDECSFEDRCRRELGNICVNTLGSYACNCHTGFRAEKLACLDVDECAETPGLCDGIGVCENALGSYRCVCQLGYRGNGTHCEDENECASGKHGCDTNARCGNIIGSYFCQCYQGFNGDGHSCYDVDECSLNNGGCQHICFNIPGTYQCSCRDGYQLMDDTMNCTDIDECKLQNGGCSHGCTNRLGGYSCECPTLLVLDMDNRTCVNITSCELRNGGCSHICTERVAGEVECSCRAGWELSDNQLVCQDVDECGDFTNGGCEQQCVNHPGSFNCSCNKGYEVRLDDPSKCQPVCDPPCQNYGVCVAPNTCDCPAGYPGPGCSEPVLCEKKCKNGGVCMGYNRCLCESGFTGDLCETGLPVPTPPPGNTHAEPNRAELKNSMSHAALKNLRHHCNPGRLPSSTPGDSMRSTLVFPSHGHSSQGQQPNFKEVVNISYGDFHAMGIKYITFVRQILAASAYPELLKSGQLPVDIEQRIVQFFKDWGKQSIGSYSEDYGIGFVRRNVARFIKKRDGGIACDPENIYITNGATNGLQLILRLFDYEEGPSQTGVLVPVPSYTRFRIMVDVAGGVNVPYYLNEERSWALDMTELKRAVKCAREHCSPKILYFINPGNPTGQVMSRRIMEDIIKFAAEEKLLLVADEVYQDQVFGDNCSFLSFKKVLFEMESVYRDNVELVSVNSVSKAYLGEGNQRTVFGHHTVLAIIVVLHFKYFTFNLNTLEFVLLTTTHTPSIPRCGFRCGYMETVNIDPEATTQLRRLMTSSCHPSIIGQIVLDILMKPPQPGEPSYENFNKEKTFIMNTLARNSKLAVQTINALPGLRCNPIQASMFCYTRIELPSKALGQCKVLDLYPSLFYCMQLLDETGIVLDPGTGFGENDGRDYIRYLNRPECFCSPSVPGTLKTLHPFQISLDSSALAVMSLTSVVKHKECGDPSLTEDAFLILWTGTSIKSEVDHVTSTLEGIPIMEP